MYILIRRAITRDGRRERITQSFLAIDDGVVDSDRLFVDKIYSQDNRFSVDIFGQLSLELGPQKFI